MKNHAACYLNGTPVRESVPTIPSGWRKLKSAERTREGDLRYDELLGAFRPITALGFPANNCPYIRKENGTPCASYLQGRRRDAARWHFEPRLSWSENHKGYSLYTPSGSMVGEIYPGDQDGDQGKHMAEIIVKALNAATFIKP